MDGFGDSFVPISNNEDPAADFLAREQNELAGLDDDIAPATHISPVQGTGITEITPFPSEEPSGAYTPPTPTASLDNDLFGESETFDQASANEITNNYSVYNQVNIAENDDKPVDLDDYTRDDNADIDYDAMRVNGMTPSPVPVREEPEKIRLWREAQKLRLEEKDEAEGKAKEELRAKAKNELEEWYKQHEEQVTKTRQTNRESSKSAEKDLVADTSKMEPGTEWERIAKLCDFNPKTAKSSRDISRMRSIILQVKQNPPVKA